MKETRMTKKDYFKEILALVEGNAELTAFVKHEIELVSKKRNSVNSKKVAEVEAMTEAVYKVLVELGRPATATEIAGVMEISNQKASAYLKKLVDAERVSKATDKRVSYFSVIAK